MCRFNENEIVDNQLRLGFYIHSEDFVNFHKDFLEYLVDETTSIDVESLLEGNNVLDVIENRNKTEIVNILDYYFNIDRVCDGAIAEAIENKIFLSGLKRIQNIAV